MSDINVSKHAIVRFVERYDAFDLQIVENELLKVFPEEAVKLLGDGVYPDKTNRVKFVVKDSTVITVLPLRKDREIPKQHFPVKENNAIKKQERDWERNKSKSISRRKQKHKKGRRRIK